jgi:hypothetical protein
LLGFRISLSSLKNTSGNSISHIFASKAIIIKKITSLFCDSFPIPKGESILDTSTDIYIPPLPLHVLPGAEWLRIHNNLNKGQLFEWGGCKFLPLRVDPDQSVYAVRLVIKTVYESSGRKTSVSMVCQPIEYQIGGELYYRTEEACRFRGVFEGTENPNSS